MTFDVENEIDSSNVNVIFGPYNGSAIFNAATGALTYNPNPGFVGMDSLFYFICDKGLPIYCDTGLVIIEVLDDNFPPVAVNDAASTNEDTSIKWLYCIS